MKLTLTPNDEMININKKSVEPMGELIGAILITIIIVIVAMSVLFSWFGGFITPEENAKQSGRNLAEGLDSLVSSIGISPGVATVVGGVAGGVASLAGIRACNEVDISVLEGYRLVLDAKAQTVTSQYCEKIATEGACESEVKSFETHQFKTINNCHENGICSPYFFDNNPYLTHCDESDYDTEFANMDMFSQADRFSGSDFLVINSNFKNHISGTYCVCAVNKWSGYSQQIAERTIIYSKGWSPTCWKLFDKLSQQASEAIGSRIKQSFASAYERIKKWLADAFGGV